MGSAAVNASKNQNVVAVCDVDWREDNPFDKRSPVKIAATVPNAKRFSDFRVMLDEMGDKIDVVMVSTADHAHFSVGMAAMQAGKHVFVQKPLAHNIWQARTMQKAAETYKVQSVMGNQGHCTDGIRRVVDWFNAGILGDVTEVHCWTDRPAPSRWFTRPTSLPPKASPVPDNYNWDVWQAQTPGRDFSNEYMPQKWRGWWDYGCGGLGDIGCHLLDAPFWALKLGYPEGVEVVEVTGHKNTVYTPDTAHIIYHFPKRGALPPVKLHWYEGGPRPKALDGIKKQATNGMYMIGSKETLYHDGMRANEVRLNPYDNMRKYVDIIKNPKTPRSVGSPFEELFAAVRGDIDKPGSNFDYAAPLTEVVLLGVMAIRSGKSVEWDPKAMTVTNNSEAQSWVKEPVRKGWSYGEDLWT
jgi:predicted dehydrogenase